MRNDPLRTKANQLRDQLRLLATKLCAGDDSHLVVWVIPSVLAVAHRPLRHHPVFGGSGRRLPAEAASELQSWLRRIVDQGFRGLICLMHAKEIAHYADLDLGAADILALYRAQGLEVCHIPWDDPAHRAPDQLNSFDDELARVRVEALGCFDRLPKPVLLHCSAGIDRSSPVCAYIHQQRAQDAPNHALEPSADGRYSSVTEAVARQRLTQIVRQPDSKIGHV